MSCSNNLHNIGLACINVHDTVKHLPISIGQWGEDWSKTKVWIGPTNGKMDVSQWWSWIQRKRLDRRHPFANGGNGTQ